MDVTLSRKTYTVNGIFGELLDNTGESIAVTLEHAFAQRDGTFRPALPPGQYQCVLGTHNLDHSQGDLLYAVTNVPDHTGILIHVGNFNRDSDGCILLGTAQVGTMITGSARALSAFMKEQNGENFNLTVEDSV